MSQKNFKKLFTIYFIIFGAMISIISGIISYNIQLNSFKDELNSKANEIMLIKKFLILKEEIKSFDYIVKSLPKSNILKEYIQDQNVNKLNKLEDVFLIITNTNRNVEQLRYIDKNGVEIIKINKKNIGDEAYLVPKNELQNKSNREYFKIVSAMTEMKVWYSKFNLNIEHGKIETPYKPTIRVAIPIFNKLQKFEGMIIVNLLTKKIFKSIGNSSTFEHYIVDKDGNYILHPDEQYSFNKYTGVKRDLKKDFPNITADILSTYKTFNNNYIYDLSDVIQNEDKAILILKPKKEYQEQFLKDRILSTIYIIILSMLASVLMALYVSRQPSELQKALYVANRELNRFASILDKYVVSARTKKDSTIVEVSSAFADSSGYTKEELIGKPMRIIRNKDTSSSIISDLWDKLLNNQAWDGEIKNTRKDGSDFWLEQHIVAVKNEDDKIESFLSVSQDITLKKEFELLSSMDKLTGILNRRKLDEFLDYEVESANRYKQNLSLIIIDIDHFKEVNDTYGHQVGDFVLSQTTKIISSLIRKSDIFGRFGGEEFLIIAPYSSKEESFILAEKLREKISNYNFKEVGYKTISLGIAQLEENEDVKSLVKNADTALYEAKNSGRNKSVIYKPKS
nr:diguanylate cyclase [uncultured Sulfurimonas sp.]